MCSYIWSISMIPVNTLPQYIMGSSAIVLGILYLLLITPQSTDYTFIIFHTTNDLKTQMGSLATLGLELYGFVYTELPLLEELLILHILVACCVDFCFI